MNVMSKTCLTIFEILNELYMAAGSGVMGLALLISHGYQTNHILRTLSVVSISLGSLIYVCQSTSEKIQPSLKKIIFISGCDSGLGYSLAIHTATMGYTVIAGFLNLQSAGAKEIKKINSIKQIELDITNRESVFVAVETINQYVNSNPNYEFYALINNAGVMVFGEFEWQTDKLISQQLCVNLHGTMHLTKSFIPLLRKHKGRIINITSHCSYACLPGLSVYGATKAGLKAFSDGLRVELSKYGVKVIMFTPGTFVTQSNIMAKHNEHFHEMHKAFTKEQHAFYEDYFQRYNSYLLAIVPPKQPKVVEDAKLYSQFEEAVACESPKSLYTVEPFRYAVYHLLFKYSPTPIRDYLVVKFMSMPEYHVNQSFW